MAVIRLTILSAVSSRLSTTNKYPFFKPNLLYTVSQKTVPTYFLLLVSQIRTDFNKKLAALSPNKPLTKLFLKRPLHLKYVLALPWEI